MAFKLLLVDDEYSTRDHIISRIDWEKLDIDQIKQAEDGVQAVKVCEDFTPDILLTDVRMPRLNGISLATELTNKFPELKVIFISGYADKQYLKSAIEIKAVRYIEKPINMKDLFRVLKNTVEMVKSRNTQLSEIKELRTIETNILKDYIAQSLTSSNFSLAECQRSLESINYNKADYGLSIAIKIHILEMSEDTNFDLFARAEIVALYDMFKSSTAEIIATIKNQSIIVFLIDKKKRDYMDMYSLVNRISGFMQNRISVICGNIAVGVGTFVKEWEQLPTSFKHSKLAVHQCFFKKPNSICFYKIDMKQSFNFSQFDLTEFIHCLKKDSPGHITFFVRNLTTNIKNYESTSISDVINLYYSMISKLTDIAHNEGIEIYSDFSGEQDIWSYINKLSYIDQLCDFLLKGVNNYYSAIKNSQYDNETISRIIRHIRKNYNAQDLSLTSISLENNLSYTYICHLFKEVTGNTLHKFILDYRMKKAMEFIGDSKYKVKDVAGMVGYRNGNYFSLKFKNYTGLTPTEYRKKTHEFH